MISDTKTALDKITQKLYTHRLNSIPYEHEILFTLRFHGSIKHLPAHANALTRF